MFPPVVLTLQPSTRGVQQMRVPGACLFMLLWLLGWLSWRHRWVACGHTLIELHRWVACGHTLIKLHRWVACGHTLIELHRWVACGQTLIELHWAARVKHWLAYSQTLIELWPKHSTQSIVPHVENPKISAYTSTHSYACMPSLTGTGSPLFFQHEGIRVFDVFHASWFQQDRFCRYGQQHKVRNLSGG